jgi:hypothetical protein
MHRRHAFPAALVAALLAASSLAAPADAQFRPSGFTVVPQVGIAFHGDVYDDRVITTFEGTDDVVVRNLTVDPGTALRVEGRLEYDYLPGVRFHGGLGLSWPGADVSVGDETQSGVDVSVLEINGGATLELGEITTQRLPVYVGVEAGIAHHGFDEFRWRDEFVDPSATSLTVGGRVGVEYPLMENLSLRGELKQSLVWGAFGDFESDIAAVEGRVAGQPADVDLEGNTFSMFSLNAGLAISF